MYNKCSIKVRDDDKDSLWNIFNGKIFTPKQHEAADTLVQHGQVSECPWFPSMDSTLPRHPFHYIQPHGALFLSKGLQGDGLIELSGSLSWALIILWLLIVF